MGERSVSGRRGPDLKEKALRELRRFLVMFLYLWLLFAISDLHRTLILAESHVNYQAQGFAAVNALMLAKVMLLAEDLRIGRRFQDRMRIISILYQAFALTLLFIAFHVVEKALVGHFEGKTLPECFPFLGGGESLLVILSSGALIFVALVPFFAFKEIADAIGAREMAALMFGRKAGRLSAPTARRAEMERAGRASPPFWRMSSSVTALIPQPWAAVALRDVVASDRSAF